MQLIDLERRLGSHDVVLGLYKKLTKKIPDNRKSIRTWISMKLSRFQLKVMNAEEKALKTLQAALKKDKNDHRLYTQIIDICYQRTPQNINGVTSAIGNCLQCIYFSDRSGTVPETGGVSGFGTSMRNGLNASAY